MVTAPAENKATALYLGSLPDSKRDYSGWTWLSSLVLLHPRELFITVDHWPVWRRHLAWAKPSGKELRSLLTQRFSSNMVFLSMMLGAELQVLFNPTNKNVRDQLRAENLTTVEFWLGCILLLAVFETFLTLIANFTAWGMIASISDENAPCLLRSSMGQYVTQLPSRLILISIYFFLISLILFLFVLVPGVSGKVILFIVVANMSHIVYVYSGFGRLIIHSGAMAKTKIFDEEYESQLHPKGLHVALLLKARKQQKRRQSVTAQYEALAEDDCADREDPVVKTSRTVLSESETRLPHPSVLNETDQTLESLLTVATDMPTVPERGGALEPSVKVRSGKGGGRVASDTNFVQMPPDPQLAPMGGEEEGTIRRTSEDRSFDSAIQQQAAASDPGGETSSENDEVASSANKSPRPREFKLASSDRSQSLVLNPIQSLRSIFQNVMEPQLEKEISQTNKAPLGSVEVTSEEDFGGSKSETHHLLGGNGKPTYSGGIQSEAHSTRTEAISEETGIGGRLLSGALPSSEDAASFGQPSGGAGREATSVKELDVESAGDTGN